MDKELHKRVLDVNDSLARQGLRELIVAQELGIEGLSVTGAEFEKMNDAKIATEIDNIGVVARVAMGVAGTDVAKEAADMVLADDNYKLWLSFLWAIVGMLLITELRILREVFNTSFLTLEQWALCLVAAAAVLLLGELMKPLLRLIPRKYK